MAKDATPTSSRKRTHLAPGWECGQRSNDGAAVGSRGQWLPRDRSKPKDEDVGDTSGGVGQRLSPSRAVGIEKG